MFGGHYTAYAQCSGLADCVANVSAEEVAGPELTSINLSAFPVRSDGTADGTDGTADGTAGMADGKWYKFDDELVIELTSVPHQLQQTIVSESAYLLFFRKRELSRENLIRYL